MSKVTDLSFTQKTKGYTLNMLCEVVKYTYYYRATKNADVSTFSTRTATL